ncbi:hypothetical protein [Nakamurella endophytica]|uniref:Uncharacterized protein n=1 Tax=Nakamurella endophytica TaxID=1748367 RepID=A0A917SMA3_9ACTN|nr:hypothetical protein [Nakamurella endophytica]GGL88030.1 hypothetical protein GCM10011594_04590 [Nakamurella endophytica]
MTGAPPPAPGAGTPATVAGDPGPDAPVDRVVDGAHPQRRPDRGARPVDRWATAARRQWATAAVFAVALAAYQLRIPGVVRTTLYAEDGREFVGDWLGRAGPWVLFQPYAGYQHVVPRLLALVTRGLAPVSWWPAVLSALAGVTVAATCAAVFRLSARFLALPAARWLVALVPVLVPLAGLEAIGDVANLHWFALYLLPWCLLAGPGSRVAQAGLFLAAAGAALTEVQSVVLAPLVALLVWRRLRGGRWAPGNPAAVAGWALGAAAQLATVLLSRAARPADLHDLLSGVDGYALNAAVSTVAAGDPSRVVAAAGWPAVWALVLVVWAAAAAAAARRPAVRLLLATLVLCSAASWALGFFLNLHAAFDYHRLDPALGLPLVRWGTAAALLLAATVPVAADVVARLRPALALPVSVALAALATVMVIGSAVGVPGETAPSWERQVDRATARCAAGGVRVVPVPTYPAGWRVVLPCSLLR